MEVAEHWLATVAAAKCSNDPAIPCYPVMISPLI